MSFRYRQDEYVASTWTLEQMPLKDALGVIHRCGFKDVEIWADTVHLDPRTRPHIAQVQSLVKAYGMGVHSLHAPFRNFVDRPLDDRAFCQMRADLIKRAVDYAQALECGILVVHAVDRKEYNIPMAQLSMVIDTIGEIVGHGKLRGVRIAIEDIPPGGQGGEIVTTLRNQRALFEGLGVDYCLDIGHVPLLGADVYDEVDAAGAQLITLHIHNNDGRSDDHNLPGDGVLDWPALHDYIRRQGYQGKFVLEIFGGKTAQEELSVMEAMGALFQG